MKRILRSAILALLCYFPLHGMCWGVEGHRVVGQVADSYLGKKARKEISRILGTESLAMAANWGDFVKSDPAYNYLYNWHFINFRGGASAEEFQAYLDHDTATDIFTKMNFLIAELKRKELDAQKRVFYLKMLIHLVGDAHQPLHAGRPEDLGGNKVHVTWFNEPKNLHQVWDDQLVVFQQLSYTEYSAAINFTTEAERNEWQQDPPGKWLVESYQLAEKIYADIKAPDQKLDYKYNYNYVSTLNRQLLKGGVRLAGILNSIFG
jgi:hypothetical protein